jgi:hypothetical protein
MKKAFRVNEIMLIIGLVLTGLLCVAFAGKAPGNEFVMNVADDQETAPLVLQPLDYTENPIDIPNPDRGFEQSNDDHVGAGPLVLLPNGGSTNSGSDWIPVYGPRYVGNTSTPCEPGIIQFYIDMRHFSSGAWINRECIEKGTSRALTPEALAYLREKLQFIRDNTNCTVHLRPTYDGMGWSYRNRSSEPEPLEQCTVGGFTHLNWIQYHILQLKPVFHEFEDIIMGVDTGILGPWGEMHTTSAARNPEIYAMVFEALLDAVPASRSLIGHVGGFMAWYNVKYGTSYDFSNMDNLPEPPEGSPEARFGMFNDSYSRGGTDGGSLSEGVLMFQGASRDDFDRDKVHSWIRGQNNFYGGEFGGGRYDTSASAQIYHQPPSIFLESSFTQTVYLCIEWSTRRHVHYANFIYNKENVDKDLYYPHNGQTKRPIFDPVYDGKNGAEYFRDRLGYRLVLREAKTSEFIEQNGILRFEGKIQNVGFGNVVNRKNVSVILKPKAGSNTYIALTNLDARDWRPDLDSRADNTAAWRNLNFSMNMGAFGEVPPGDYDIYLKINDPKEQSANKRCIRFANKGNSWNADLGANLIGSTTVTP